MRKDWFFCVDEPFENTLVINKSRFITTLLPVENYDDAIEKYKSISKKYSDATHNCYAFISNSQATEQRFSDDGEPQGTAGMPMLEVLKKRKVYMTLAVVTRYFGGIKLGANGLVGAYSSSVAEALDKAVVAKNQPAVVYEVVASYGLYKKIEEKAISMCGEILSTAYDNDVTLTVVLPEEKGEDFCNKVVDLSQDKAKITLLEERYHKFR